MASVDRVMIDLALVTIRICDFKFSRTMAASSDFVAHNRGNDPLATFP
jgi:hypothetical protein